MAYDAIIEGDTDMLGLLCGCILSRLEPGGIEVTLTYCSAHNEETGCEEGTEYADDDEA